MMQFTELESEWSCTYAGMIETFARRGVFDEETQKNDLNIVREVLKVTKECPSASTFQRCGETKKRADPSQLEILNLPRRVLRARYETGFH